MSANDSNSNSASATDSNAPAPRKRFSVAKDNNPSLVKAVLASRGWEEETDELRK